jgi:antitoxin FitA
VCADQLYLRLHFGSISQINLYVSLYLSAGLPVDVPIRLHFGSISETRRRRMARWAADPEGDSVDINRWKSGMASLVIRNLDDDLKQRLREQAAAHGRSMEQEVRELLAAGVRRERVEARIGTRIHERFAAVGFVDLDLAERSDQPRSVDFEQ